MENTPYPKMSAGREKTIPGASEVLRYSIASAAPGGNAGCLLLAMAVTVAVNLVMHRRSPATCLKRFQGLYEKTLAYNCDFGNSFSATVDSPIPSNKFVIKPRRLFSG